MSHIKLYGSLTKDAGFWDYVGAANKGAGIGTQGINPNEHPIDFMTNGVKGAFKGVAGHEASAQLAGAEQQGFAFNKDPYGRMKNVDLMGSVKGVGNNMISGLGDTASKLYGSATSGQGFSGLMKNFGEGTSNFLQNTGNFINNPTSGGGFQGFLQNAGNYLSQNKGALLGSAAALGGGYLLKNMLFPGGQPSASNYQMPPSYHSGYQGGQVPGAFDKMGSFDFMPSPMQLPDTAASLITGGINIPGLAGDYKHQHLAPQEPYQPDLQTDNKQLKRNLQDPRMREYLATLIKQTESNNDARLE